MYDFAYPQTQDAQERGWGRGWEPGMPIGSRPVSYPGVIVPLSVEGVSFPGGIREELAELAGLLVEHSLGQGWIPSLDDPGCWGGAFRPTKASDGSYTTTPSNHSWYTAVDINAPHNVYGSLDHQIPQVMADLWKTYGWRWLGPPIRDWMHFDFAGTPGDAADMTIKARANLGGDMTGDDLFDGVRAYLEGGPLPNSPGGLKMYNALIRAGNNPKPGAHTHPQADHVHPAYSADGHKHQVTGTAD